VLFISASVLMLLWLGRWCLPAHVVGACASFAVAAALVVYEIWFLRKTRKMT
jgi:hypothetical protein